MRLPALPTIQFPALPTLRYTVNRKYPWSWFTPVLVGGIFVALCILIPVEVALAGYDTIVVSSKEFNAVPHHWWYAFGKTATPKPGSLCAPANFTAGDSFATTYGIFQYNIISTNWTDYSTPFVEYKGTNLDGCDVQFLEVDGNLVTSTIGLSAVVVCTDDDLPLLLRTSWAPWGVGSDFFADILRYSANGVRVQGSAAASRILSAASEDLFDAMLDSQSTTQPSSFNLDFYFNYLCNKKSTNFGLAHCNDTVNFPLFTPILNRALVTGTNGTVKLTSDIATIGQSVDNALNNLLYIFYSAVRLDLGYVLPNNLLTNMSTALDSLTFNGGPNSALYQAVLNATANDIEYPVSAQTEAAINVSFQCKYKFAKGAAEILLAVFIATFSLFMSGWGGAMFVAAYYATKDEDKNYCEGHEKTAKEVEDFRSTYTPGPFSPALPSPEPISRPMSSALSPQSPVSPTAKSATVPFPGAKSSSPEHAMNDLSYFPENGHRTE